MTSRTIRSAILPVAVLAALSCSKTQDTAPERRLFGDPPVINKVTDPFFEADHFISCDWTQRVVNEICFLGAASNLEAQPGAGWTFDVATGRGGVGNDPTTAPGVFLQGTYGEVVFNVTATDPNSTSSQNNILLVSASYLDPDPNSKTEKTLVLFDDGSFSKFNNPQKVTSPGENCVVNPDGSCECFLAVYPVTSGDSTANDNLWTRKVALVDKTANAFLLDCIMSDAHETLISSDPGAVFQFKIEAVDRQGNLTTWPNKPTAVTSTSLNKFLCNGDSCGCCILQSHDPATDCHGLPGMVSTDMPDGLCRTLF